MVENIPVGDNSLLSDTISTRKISWLERVLGPENFRIVTGLIQNTCLDFRIYLNLPLCAGRCFSHL